MCMRFKIAPVGVLLYSVYIVLTARLYFTVTMLTAL